MKTPEARFISRCRVKMKQSNAHAKRHKGDVHPEDKMADEDLLELFHRTKVCYRCGLPIDFETKSGVDKCIQFTLDRLQNGKSPYIKGNVEISHHVCNTSERYWGRTKNWTPSQYKERLFNKLNTKEKMKINVTLNGVSLDIDPMHLRIVLGIETNRSAKVQDGRTNKKGWKMEKILNLMKSHNSSIESLSGSDIKHWLIEGKEMTKEQWDRESSTWYKSLSKIKSKSVK